MLDLPVMDQIAHLVGREKAATGCMQRLDRGHDIQCCEARDVVRVHHLQVLDPVAAVALAICRLRGLQRVNGPADAGIADGMHRNLKAQPVRLGAGWSGIHLQLPDVSSRQ